MRSALDLLLFVAGRFYEPFESRDAANIAGAVELASKNRMLYHFSSECLKLVEAGKIDVETSIWGVLNSAKELGDAYFRTFERTYGIVKRALGEEHLLFKTFMGYPCVCNDLDIIVPDLQRAGQEFVKLGYRPIQDEKYKMLIQEKDLLPVSLHERVAWGDVTIMDEETMWEHPRSVRIHEVEVKVPSIEGDLTAMIGHIPFETLKITLGDLLGICSFARHADIRRILNQAGRHGWGRSFISMAATLDMLHRDLYDTPSPFEKLLPLPKRIVPTYPYVLPLSEICRAHVEKRAWKKIAKFPFFIRIKIGL